MTTTEELQLRITALTLQTEKYDTDQKSLAAELAQAKRDLKEVNKPTLSAEHYNTLIDTIADKLSEFDFEDSDSYDMDFGIDYDGRVHVESMSFNNTDELQRLIEESIELVFKTID